jgi:16S rRNA (cytidine1402-2'-O)-methyltransferase
MGRVEVVATPIGNLEDLSPRALRVLREADAIACEDTRRTGRLAAHFEIPTRRISLHAYNEARRIPEILALLQGGACIALVSDAGTPLLSDPGAQLVRAALDAGHEVSAVPGPSSILAALAVSGLPLRPFTFVGFLPRKGSARRGWLETLRTLPGAVVLFESPYRVARTLADLFDALGPRRVVLARELTKKFEDVRRGRLGELDVKGVKGEVTLVVEGSQGESDEDLELEDDGSPDQGPPARAPL